MIWTPLQDNKHFVRPCIVLFAYWANERCDMKKITLFLLITGSLLSASVNTRKRLRTMSSLIFLLAADCWPQKQGWLCVVFCLSSNESLQFSIFFQCCPFATFTIFWGSPWRWATGVTGWLWAVCSVSETYCWIVLDEACGTWRTPVCSVYLLAHSLPPLSVPPPDGPESRGTEVRCLRNTRQWGHFDEALFIASTMASLSEWILICLPLILTARVSTTITITNSSKSAMLGFLARKNTRGQCQKLQHSLKRNPNPKFTDPAKSVKSSGPDSDPSSCRKGTVLADL